MKTQAAFPAYPPRFMVRMFTGFRDSLLRVHRRFTHPSVVLWEMVHNMWLAAGIGVAAELGIADLVAKGPVHISVLAKTTGSHEESLYRVMRMLASQGIFREKKNRIFAPTRLSGALREEMVRYLILMHLTPWNFRKFAELPEIVQNGTPVDKPLLGQELFGHIADNKQRNQRFNRAMTNATWMQVPALIPAFPFRDYRNIIDVGGGLGMFLAAILEDMPETRGIVFDIPSVVTETKSVIDAYSLGGRMECREGDFFREVPAGGDLYMLKSVLHDWNDKDAARILRNVRKVMDSHARLLVIETILRKDHKPSFGKMTDILMMVATGGKERTKAEYERLLHEAGFRIRKIHPTISPHSLIEAVISTEIS